MFEILLHNTTTIIIYNKKELIENTKVKIQFCESRHKEEQYFIVYIYITYLIFLVLFDIYLYIYMIFAVKEEESIILHPNIII